MAESEIFDHVTYGHLREIKNLITQDPNVVKETDEFRFTPLHYLAGEEHWEIVHLLIANGADVNARNDVGITPLHIACWPEMVDILLDNGADINARDKDGSTPLYIQATEPDSEEVIARLLARGADPTIPNNRGETPANVARLREDWEKVDLLEAAGRRNAVQ